MGYRVMMPVTIFRKDGTTRDRLVSDRDPPDRIHVAYAVPVPLVFAKPWEWASVAYWHAARRNMRDDTGRRWVEYHEE